jgi:hypothetical protein
MYHARSKHIDVKFHKIRELIATSELLLEKIHTFENVVDMLTKLANCRQIQSLFGLDICLRVLERRG